MRIRHLAAATVSVSCALLAASCLQSPTGCPETAPDEVQRSSSTGPIGEARQEIGRHYVPEDFSFHFLETTFLFPTYFWQCPVRIGMPIRSEVWGPIAPSRAALYSAEIATAVVDPLLESRTAWRNQGEDFCQELKKGMLAMFKVRYPKLNVTVSRP
jgi:hypothetical protein